MHKGSVDRAPHKSQVNISMSIETVMDEPSERQQVVDEPSERQPMVDKPSERQPVVDEPSEKD